MTLSDPYPPDLLDADGLTPIERTLGEKSETEDLIQTIHRLAQAVEQLVLATLPQPTKERNEVFVPLPPVQTQTIAVGSTDPTFDGCPTHHQPWKVVPAGVSKKTGRSYESFRACPVAGCNQRPRL